jgi:AraC-like DNA-binding protein
VPTVAALVPSAEASLSIKRSLPAGGSWTLVRCLNAAHLQRALVSRLVDAVVFSPASTPLTDLTRIRGAFPQVPWIAFAPFRPDDGPLLLACHEGRVTLVLVDGVDSAVAGDLVVRNSAAAERRRALADAPRLLRLSEPLQREVWHYLLDRVDSPVRTGDIARNLGCSREHLSRQFGAGGAPNLKRVIDLTRIACAASLLRNPGYDAQSVARILRFATASHLSATARRITGVSTRGLSPLGPRGVLAAFARDRMRSRLG